MNEAQNKPLQLQDSLAVRILICVLFPLIAFAVGRHWRKNRGSRRFPLAPLSRMMRGRWKYQWRLLPLFFRIKVSLN